LSAGVPYEVLSTTAGSSCAIFRISSKLVKAVPVGARRNLATGTPRFLCLVTDRVAIYSLTLSPRSNRT
jgi:hypothetical protein